MPIDDPIVKHYDAEAVHYDRRWRAYINATIKAVSGTLSLNGRERLLDAPCGTGALESWLSVHHPTVRVVGVDASRSMLSFAKAKHVDAGYTWLQADVLCIPLDDASFDVVVCANSFHCFDRPREVLAEFRRLLKPNGRLILLDWCDDFLLCKLCSVWFRFVDRAYRRMFTSAECRRLLGETGFRIRSSQAFRHRIVWGLMLFDCERVKSAATP
jgi:ubiquinone/menaquinone biosynthesis C-methylase UbiE